MSKSVGMNKFDEKDRRAVRRRNHVARDLRSPKYAPRVVRARTREDEDERRFRRYGLEEIDKDNLDGNS